MRVIPPVTGAATTITPAMMTSTNVYETAPVEYSAVATYPVDGYVSDRSANEYKIYRSKVDANTGNTPATSPDFWEYTGSTYPVYSNLGNYAKDDRVIDATAHLVYKSLIPANVGFPLTDTTRWELEGATARWAPFDTLRSTGARRTTPIQYVLTPGQRIDAVGLGAVNADKVKITLRSGGEIKFEREINMVYRNTLSWSDYFYGAFNRRSTAAVFDLPAYTDAEVTIDIYNDLEGSTVEVGSIFIGKSVFLGDVLESPQVSGRNFSTVNRKFDGTATLIQRRTVPTNSVITVVDKEHILNVEKVKKTLNAVVAMWSGLDDPTDPYFEPLLIVGFYTRFDVFPETAWARVTLDLEET